MKNYVGAVASGANLDEAITALAQAIQGSASVYEVVSPNGSFSFASAGRHNTYSPVLGKIRQVPKKVGMLATASAHSDTDSLEVETKQCGSCHHFMVATAKPLLETCPVCGGKHLRELPVHATAAIFAGEPIVAYPATMATAARGAKTMPPAVSKSYYDHPDFPLISSILKKHANRKADNDLSSIVRQVNAAEGGKVLDITFAQDRMFDMYASLFSLEQAALNNGVNMENAAHKNKGKSIGNLKPVPWKDDLRVQALYSYFRALAGLPYYPENSEKNTTRLNTSKAFYKDAKKKHAPISFDGLKKGLAVGDSAASEVTETKSENAEKVEAEVETNTTSSQTYSVKKGSKAAFTKAITNLKNLTPQRGLVKAYKAIFESLTPLEESLNDIKWLAGGKATGIETYTRFLETGKVGLLTRVFNIDNKTLRTKLYRSMLAFVTAIEDARAKKTPLSDSKASELYYVFRDLLNAIPNVEGADNSLIPKPDGITRAAPPSSNRVMLLPVPKVVYGDNRSNTPQEIPAFDYDTILKKALSTQATKFPQHREIAYIFARRLFESTTKAVSVLNRNKFSKKPERMDAIKRVRSMLELIMRTTETAAKDPYLNSVAGYAISDPKGQKSTTIIVKGFCELAAALSYGSGAMLTFLDSFLTGKSAFSKSIKEILSMDKAIFGEKATSLAVASAVEYNNVRRKSLAQLSLANARTTRSLPFSAVDLGLVPSDDLNEDFSTVPMSVAGMPKVSFEPDQNDASCDDDYSLGDDGTEEPLDAYLDAANDDGDSNFLSSDDGELSVASASGTVVTVDLMSETLPSFVAYATASPELNLLFSPASGQLPSRWFAEYKGVPIAVAAATTVKPQLKNLFNTDGFKTAVTSALAMSRDVKAELQNLGFLPIRAQVPISHKAEAMAMARAETQVAQLQSKQQEVLNKLSERLHTAFIGLEKHFYPDTTSPLRSALVTSAAQVGVSEAKAHALLDTALQSGAMTDHIQEAFALANRLAGMEEGVYEQHAMAIATVPYKSTQSVHAISSATKPLDMRSPAISIAAPVSAPQQPPTPTQVAIASQQQAQQFQAPDFRTPSGVLEFLTK